MCVFYRGAGCFPKKREAENEEGGREKLSSWKNEWSGCSVWKTSVHNNRISCKTISSWFQASQPTYIITLSDTTTCILKSVEPSQVSAWTHSGEITSNRKDCICHAWILQLARSLKIDGIYTRPQCPWGLEDVKLNGVGGILEVLLKVACMLVKLI